MLRRSFTTGSIGSLLAIPSMAQEVAGGSLDGELNRFFETVNQETARLSPETLTRRGLKDRYGELGDYTPAFAEHAMALADSQLAKMKRAYPRDKLSAKAQLSYDLFERLVERQRIQLKWRLQAYAVSSSGASIDILPLLLVTQHRVDTLANAQAYVSRIAAIERVAGEVADDLHDRTARGFISPKLVFARVIPDAEAQLRGSPFDSGPDQAVWADLQRKVAAMPATADQKAGVLADGRAALLGPWRRGYQRYIAALREMAAKATGDRGAWALPDGAAYYADMVKFYTTTNMTAEEVHDIGLAEVAKAREDMTAVQRRGGFRERSSSSSTTLETNHLFDIQIRPKGGRHAWRKAADEWLPTWPSPPRSSRCSRPIPWRSARWSRSASGQPRPCLPIRPAHRTDRDQA